MSISKLMEKRNEIYGICALWIILFHLYRRISMPYFPVITNIIGIGNMGVDVFFFFSGLCLSLSAQRNSYLETGWKEFFQKRFKRVLIPYLIICIPYYLWSCVFETSGGVNRKIVAFIANLSSASFWLKGTQTTWFVFGIIVFYFFFPVLFRYLQKAKGLQYVGLIVVEILCAVACSNIPVWKNSLIVWARLPIFTIGIIVGFQEQERSIKNSVAVIALFVLSLLGYITSLSEISPEFSMPQIVRFLLYIPMTLSFLFLLAFLDWKSRGLVWLGRLSLELYLVHITILHPLKYYGIIERTGNWLYLILPVISVAISLFVSWIEKNMFKRRKPI